MVKEKCRNEIRTNNFVVRKTCGQRKFGNIEFFNDFVREKRCMSFVVLYNFIIVF